MLTLVVADSNTVERTDQLVQDTDDLLVVAIDDFPRRRHCRAELIDDPKGIEGNRLTYR
jgi:hypothetical protein